ncbi:J domain-containing protein [Halosimplex salinum]|uniref:J domain-containing protein n=1 Tax=Halosimplex salinum TaxID=1710538 RepID=UPI0019D0BDF2|nr:J domain-containing protein [Halosimplex salinum]
MSRTFYGVLGVGPDAADDEIRSAYRERVKDHHPDVSAAPDAADQFKRITAAKETLVDATERARYDRLGHDTYVSSHADSSLWNDASDAPGARSETGAPAGSDSSTTTESRARSDRSRGAGRASTTGSDRSTASRTGNRTQSSTATSERDSSGRSAAESTGATSVDDEANGPGAAGSTTASQTADASTASSSASTGSVGDSRTSESKTESTGDDHSSSSDGPSGDRPSEARAGAKRRRRDRRRTRSGDRSGEAASGPYARTSFWDAAGAETSSASRSEPIVDRFLAVVRALGPWILIHLLFLSLAVGTGWYVYAVVLPPAEQSLPLLFVLVGEIGLAVVLSTLHILSTIYR